MREQMNCNQFNHAKRAGMVYRIVKLTEDGHVVIDVIKGRNSDHLGTKVIPFTALMGQIVIK